MKECGHRLSDWQTGFRPERGCRDNILLLRVLVDQVIKENGKVFLTFIDYSAAFDSVSHKFLDRSLADAGASRKTRALFRAIYAAAEGMARVKDLDDRHIHSEVFSIRRGVIQGDIISPIFFILTMEQIFRIHDQSPHDTQVGNYLQIGVLGYADDAALISQDVETMSRRLTSIAVGFETDADMTLNTGKTKNMIVEQQQKVKPPTEEDIKTTEAGYRNECEFCGRRFKTLRGMHIHRASCDKQHGMTEEEFEIERQVFPVRDVHPVRNGRVTVR